LKILLTINKTLPRNGKQELDTGYYYLQKPLEELGHEVYLYDTIKPVEPNFRKVVVAFRPDLIFCCFTGNPGITPYEPWNDILRITREENIKTFNWFCDETWRFENFSKHVCWYFTHCSTPEPDYVDKFKSGGYDNIQLGSWHANVDCYPDKDKDIDISFAGGMNSIRREFFSGLEMPVTLAENLSIDELFAFYSRSKIGINLSLNANDPEGKTQMKQRIFELAAAKALVLTEHHPAIESFFEVGKEVITFKNKDDFQAKANYYIKNPKEAQTIAQKGHARYIKDHESKVRLKRLLEVIFDEE
jgi:spore maturation protein CgeB